MNQLTEATLYRDAGAVKRYHTKRTLRVQSVAEHTFGMLMLVKQVLEQHDEVYSEADVFWLYNAIMHHDLPELYTGDVPAPIKRAHPELGPLLDSIEKDLAPLYRDDTVDPAFVGLIKWADRMELVLWGLEEFRMGNTYTTQLVSRGLGWILASFIPPCALNLTGEVVDDARTLGIIPDVGSDLEKQA